MLNKSPPKVRIMTTKSADKTSQPAADVQQSSAAAQR
jgi:hypothetical protein